MPPRSLAFATTMLLAACATAPRSGGWQLVATPGTPSLRGIAVVDASTVWLSGSGGTVWRTTDGGTSWSAVAPPGTAAADFRDVEACDGDTALVMTAGSPGRVHRTTDGGATWTLVLEDTRPATFFDAMAFLGDEGTLVGDPIDGRFCAWTTLDGGATWRELGTAAPHAEAGEAAFAASGGCVAMSRAQQGMVCWLGTGGADAARVLQLGVGAWCSGPVPLRAGAASRGVFGLAVQRVAGRPGSSALLPSPPRGAVVAVGGDYAAPQQTAGTAAWSDDGGATWHPADAGGFRSAVVWLDEHRVLAVGSHGTSRSHDGGRTWTVLGTDGFHCVACGTDGSVWAAGSDGRVAKWIDAR